MSQDEDSDNVAPENPNSTCWRELISNEMARQRSRGWTFESWKYAQALCAREQNDGEWLTKLDGPSEEWLDRKFDATYGAPEGCWFTLWTLARVYFPLEYDGSESVGSAPRNPTSEATAHL